MHVIIVVDNVNNMVKALSGKKALKLWMEKENLKFQNYTYQNENRVSEYSLVDKNSNEDDEPIYGVHYDIYVTTSKDLMRNSDCLNDCI